jgi:cation:H+ antiporter
VALGEAAWNHIQGLKGFAYTSSERLMLQNIGLILAGLAILIVGAQLLVKGASRLALALGIAPLIVGLTIVAFGTSAPELAISIQSSLAEKTDLLLGNAVGSNIYNVLFILGVTALISPVGVSRDVMVRDVPVMLAVAALSLPLMATGKKITRIEGGLLLAAYCGYLAWLLSTAKPG